MYTFASVFKCFHCVFTAKTCTIGTLHMYFRNILHVHENIHEQHFVHEMYTFASVFKCFHCVFHCKNVLLVHFTCTFGTSYMYMRIYIYSTLYMKCTLLQVFSLCFHCKNMYFWYISHVLSEHLTCT